MKIIFITLLGILFWTQGVWAELKSPGERDWSWFSKADVEYLIQKDEQNSRMQDLERVKLAKYYLFIGKPHYAKAVIKKIGQGLGRMGPVKNFYLSVIHFVEGDYQEALSLLRNINSQYFSSHKKACLMTLNTSLLTHKSNLRHPQVELCRQLIELDEDSDNSLYWFNKMFTYKTRGIRQVQRDILLEATSLDNAKELESWIKIANIADLNTEVIELLSATNNKTKEEPRIRELSAMTYLNIGDKKNAKFKIADLESVNALNTLGLSLLREGKLKEAYERFKESLKKNPFSPTALEKTIALSLRFEDYQYGLKTSKNLPNRKFDQSISALIFYSTFLTQLSQYQESMDYLEKVGLSPLRAHSNYVVQMKLMNSLFLNQTQKTSQYASEACFKDDGFSCWILSQNLLGEVSYKKNNTPEGTIEKNFQSLFETQPSLAEEENIVIDQKDIEELDQIKKISL